ncbi:MAG: ATP-binding protein [Chryseolinea sp.]
MRISITSVTQKVIAGFALVFVAIVMALAIAHFGFREMMETVDHLSAPNERLGALNTIFQEITASEQTQRAEAIRNPKNPYNIYINQTKAFVNKIDSLRLLDWDSTQQERLLEMRSILQKRNRLFLSYLKLKTEMFDNRNLSRKLDTLSKILVNEKVSYDTNVVTTEKKTITTYTSDSVATVKDNRSKLGKFFSRKKNLPPPTTHIKVEEQLSVIVDTLAIERQNKALEEVEKIIVDLETDQRKENKRLVTEELELIHANSLFINQLLSILHEVENEEVSQMRANNDRAGRLVTQSIWRISLLLILFFLGAACLVYLIWVDVTRSNYYKKQLETAKDQAEELSQIKQRFLANMSHEIRTPLQSIIGFAEQLKQSGNDNTREAVSAINSSSEHLLHIVDEVLDYSRISSGSFALSKETFGLLSLVTEVSAALSIQAERKKLSLALDAGLRDDLFVVGDPFRLRQVLYNLMGNAIKFTAKGFIKLSVRINDHKHYVNCVFEVADTGIGIKPEDMANIFNQFEQANALIARQFGGTGLGLTIAKSLVEAQGGTLQVASDAGYGSTFTVTLPFEKSSDTHPSITVHKNNGRQPFNGKVIVVDDDVMILRLCGVVLDKNQINYKTYSDGRELLKAEIDREVTHMLMDIRMPEINGIELCQAMKKRYPATTTFVALTAHVFPQEHQQLLHEGFDQVMLKPFREHELMNLFGATGNGPSTPVVAESDIDLDLLRRMTMGDEALLQIILNQLIEETTADLEKLELSMNYNDDGQAREIVHKLAGRTGQVGANAIAGKLRSLENNLSNGVPLKELELPLEQMIESIEALLKVVKIQCPNPVAEIK